MFGMSSIKKKASETERLSEDFRQKISELYLRVESGDLSPQELTMVRNELERLRRQIDLKIETNTKARPATV